MSIPYAVNFRFRVIYRHSCQQSAREAEVMRHRFRHARFCVDYRCIDSAECVIRVGVVKRLSVGQRDGSHSAVNGIVCVRGLKSAMVFGADQ